MTTWQKKPSRLSRKMIFMMRKWILRWNWRLIYMTVTERRAQEVARQKKRNKRDLFRCIFYIVALIAWAMVLVGFSDFIAGGW